MGNKNICLHDHSSRTLAFLIFLAKEDWKFASRERARAMKNRFSGLLVKTRFDSYQLTHKFAAAMAQGRRAAHTQPSPEGVSLLTEQN